MVDALEKVSELTGKVISWLVLIMAALVFILVVLRNFFGVGSIATQELVLYLHATLFMLLFAYTLKNEGHIRVDVLYRTFGQKSRAWINAIGVVVLLIPFSTFLILISLPSVETSWRIKEASGNTGGLPAVFLIKTLIPLSGLLLLIQAFAELGKAVNHLIYANESFNNNKD